MREKRSIQIALILTEDKRIWRVQQMLVDLEEHNNQVAEVELDFARSSETEEPLLRLVRIGSLA